MTAYAYLRKSVVHDSTREVSPAVQEDAVRALAALHDDGDDLVLLSDWDKSGRLGADKRPGYAALLSAIEDGRCTAIYSYSLSRLSRSLVELLRLVDLCTARRIPIRLRADAIDTGTASGMLLLQVLGAVSEFESTVAKERAADSIARRVAAGGRAGTVKNFGEREGEDAAAVLAAFDEAGSFSAAAKLLNARGIKPRNSKRGWWPSSVAVVVERLRPEYRRKERGVRAGGSSFLLARLIKCPTCRTALTGTRDREGRRVRYSCRMGTVLPHPRISITESKIIDAVMAEAARFRLPDPDVEMMAADLDKRAALEAKRLRVVDSFMDGIVTKPERDHRLGEIGDEMAKLDARRVVIRVRGVEWNHEPGEINRALRTLWEGIDLDPATFQPLPDGFRWLVPAFRG